MVSGEELTVQHKNRDPFSLEPKAAHCFNSNHMLKTYDNSDGFNRRWLIFEFNNRVDPYKGVIDLDAQILEHEREAIVAWANQATSAWRSRASTRCRLHTSHLSKPWRPTILGSSFLDLAWYPAQVERGAGNLASRSSFKVLAVHAGVRLVAAGGSLEVCQDNEGIVECAAFHALYGRQHVVALLWSRDLMTKSTWKCAASDDLKSS